MPDVQPAEIDDNLLRLLTMGSGGQRINLDQVRRNTVTPIDPNIIDPTRAWLAPTSDALNQVNQVAPQGTTATSDAPEAQYLSELLQRKPQSTSDLLAQATSLAKTAASGPTEGDLQAKEAALKGDYEQQIADFLKSRPIPQAQQIENPNVPPLRLLEPPQAVPNQINPVAQLAAAVAGLVAPQAAGQFNAAALEGSIKHAQQLTQQNHVRYQEQIRNLTQIHQDVQESADRKLRVDTLNMRAKAEQSAEQRQQDMTVAEDTAKAAMLHGTASVIQDHEAQAKPSREAAAALSMIHKNIEDISKENQTLQHLQTTAADTLARIHATAQEKEATRLAQAQLEADKEAARMEVVKAQQAGQTERTNALITAANTRARASNDIRAEANKIRRELGSGGKSGQMVHASPATKAAEKEMNINAQLYSKAEADYQKTKSPEDKAAAESALAAYRASSTRFVTSGQADREAFRGGGSKAVTPPPGAKIMRFDAQGNLIP